MRGTSVRRSAMVRADSSRGGFRWVVPLLLIAIALIAPRAASASTYRWNIAADGNWTDPANWTVVSGPAGVGYPNSNVDTAQFDPPPIANYTVTIPDGVTVTVERISFPAQNFVTIAGAGSGLLVLETTGAEVEIASTATFGLTFDVPILLKSNLLVTSAASVTFSGAVSDDGTPRGVTMAGHQFLRYTGTASNTYTGPTTVQRGRLELGKTNTAIAVAGPLAVEPVGDFAAEARLLTSENIADGAPVRVIYSGGAWACSQVMGLQAEGFGHSRPTASSARREDSNQARRLRTTSDCSYPAPPGARSPGSPRRRPRPCRP